MITLELTKDEGETLLGMIAASRAQDAALCQKIYEQIGAERWAHAEQERTSKEIADKLMNFLQLAIRKGVQTKIEGEDGTDMFSPTVRFVPHQEPIRIGNIKIECKLPPYDVNHDYVAKARVDFTNSFRTDSRQIAFMLLDSITQKLSTLD